MDKSYKDYVILADEHEPTSKEAESGRLMMLSDRDHPLINFSFECCWYRKPYVIEEREYALPFDEFFAFIGADHQNSDELGGRVEFSMAGKTFSVDKNCIIFFPRMIPHGPVSLTRVDTPIFSYSGGTGKARVPVPERYWILPEKEPALEDCVALANGRERYEELFEYIHLLPRTTNGGNWLPFTMFYWIRPTEKLNNTFAKNLHYHAETEVLCAFSLEPDRPWDLGTEVVTYLQNEPFSIRKSGLFMLPPFTPHCPLIFKGYEGKQTFFTVLPYQVKYTASKMLPTDGTEDPLPAPELNAIDRDNWWK